MPDAEPETRSAYYLDDFENVIAGVEQRYGALLDGAEQAHIATLRRLSLPALQLYVRLVNRKGPYFRVARLEYPEIGVLQGPISELIEHRLLAHCAALPEPARRNLLLSCFTLPELRAALAPHAPRSGSRPVLLAWLAAWEGLEPWAARLLAAHFLVGLPASDPWPFLRFLFFGALRANLADFVTRALGHIVTETILPDHLRPLFASRAEADDAYRMALLYREFSELRETDDAAGLLDWWRAQGIARAQLASGQPWFDRLVDRLGRRLERAGDTDSAAALYATSPVAPARERLARLHIKAGRKQEAMALLRAMEAAPCHPEEAYAARHLLARLETNSRGSDARRLQRASRSIALHYSPRSGPTDRAATVEAAVLAHYRALGWQGVHAENWLWNASFGLLLWDIIYDPSFGMFHSPLQFAPADLYTPEFYPRRQAAMEARLDLLREPPRAFEIVSRHFTAKHGIANPFVPWAEDVPETLLVLLHRVPPAGHAAVLRHMARNLRHHAHGFLDLFIWNDSEYRFIEIKGEGDQLAPHQFEWLRFFAEAGINVALERVERPR